MDIVGIKPTAPPPINKNYFVTITDKHELEGIQTDIAPPIPSFFWEMVDALREAGLKVRVQERLLVDVSDEVTDISRRLS